MEASGRDVEPSHCSHLEEQAAQKNEPTQRRKQEDGITPAPSSGHCRDHSSEPSCSIRERSASPSVRIDSSSGGSRRALQSSSAHQESHTPSPELRRTPATTESLRIGAENSLDRRIRHSQDCYNPNSRTSARPSPAFKRHKWTTGNLSLADGYNWRKSGKSMKDMACHRFAGGGERRRPWDFDLYH